MEDLVGYVVVSGRDFVFSVVRRVRVAEIVEWYDIEYDTPTVTAGTARYVCTDRHDVQRRLTMVRTGKYIYRTYRFSVHRVAT